MTITNPAFDYDSLTDQYGAIRQADPRIAAYINQALGEAKTVLNIGAGTGSYEPTDRYVMAVEPSATMRAQRVSKGRPPAVAGSAETLPFDAASFDTTIGILTIHHWPDLAAGLNELKRVTKNNIVLMTYDPDALDLFWNVHYFRELVEVERKRYPPIKQLCNLLGGVITIANVPIPLDCTDGFQEAFYGRPEAFLQKTVRQAQSAWGFISPETEARLVAAFQAELASGAWDEKYGHHRTRPFFEGALRVINCKF